MNKVFLETYICGYLITELESGTDRDILIQSDWDFPSMASALGCPWRLWDCKDISRAITAAAKWLDDNCGELTAPAMGDYFDMLEPEPEPQDELWELDDE